jgi:NitT/TauT family transport system substrate-binding protein
MRRSGTTLATAAAALAAAWAGTAEAADKLTLQLKWVTQAQFGGYYVAKDKGFYEKAGLDVEIKPGGPDIAPPQVIAGGGADVIVEWMLADPAKDFKGRTLGVWFYGNEYPFLSWMSRLGIPTQGGPDGVTVVKQGFNVDPLLQKQADCISTMTYNEYWQVVDAGLAPEDLVVFKYEDQGVATLEDGLYVLERSLQDPAMVDKLARFLKASVEGWTYAQENPDEAAEIVLENDATGAQTEEHQKRMMGEVNKLVGTGGSKGIGYLDPEDYERTVQVLLGGGSDPVISKAPEGAWTHAVFEAMGKM